MCLGFASYRIFMLSWQIPVQIAQTCRASIKLETKPDSRAKVLKKVTYTAIQKLKIGTQHREVTLKLFPSKKMNFISPRHTSPACRRSGKHFRICGKIPGRSGIKSVALCKSAGAVYNDHVRAQPMVRSKRRKIGKRTLVLISGLAFHFCTL